MMTEKHILLENLPETTPPFTALGITNFFITKGVKDEKPIIHEKLHKLLYFTHCNCIIEKKKPYIDEDPQALGYGPVFSGIFHRFKYRGKKPILFPMVLDLGLVPCIVDSYMLAVMTSIWEKYKFVDIRKLREMTDQKGKAWSMVSDNGNPNANISITPEDILKYEKEYY